MRARSAAVAFLVAVAGQSAWATTGAPHSDKALREVGVLVSFLTTAVLAVVALLVGKPLRAWGGAAFLIQMLVLTGVSSTTLPSSLLWGTIIGPLVASAALVTARVVRAVRQRR